LLVETPSQVRQEPFRIADLRDRCAELAKDQQAYAELIRQLSDQVNAIKVAVRRCLLVAATAVVRGLTNLVACAIAFLR